MPCPAKPMACALSLALCREMLIFLLDFTSLGPCICVGVVSIWTSYLCGC